MAKATKEDLELIQEIKREFLKDIINAYKSGSITSTDRATVARLLQANGISFDENDLPQDLKGKLTQNVRFDDGIDGEEPKMRVVR